MNAYREKYTGRKDSTYAEENRKIINTITNTP